MKKINVFIAGHNGMVGSSIYRILNKDPKYNIITRTSKQLDLTDQKQTHDFFQNEKIDQVYLAAAKVGGIEANNKFPADFIYQNLMIQNNIIHQSYIAGIKKLLFLGSSCIYPKFAKQPIKEEALMSGKLELTNEPYAIAKISGIKLCESYNRQFEEENIDYRSIMPTNLFGPADNYDLRTSHVVPALIRKIHAAKIKNEKILELWGTGKPLREFLYVDDLARASIFVMNLDRTTIDLHTDKRLSHLNVGSGKDISIKDLSSLISEIIDYDGDIIFDSSKPDGTMKKLMDSSKINKLGWHQTLSLEDGLKLAYKDYIENFDKYNK